MKKKMGQPTKCTPAVCASVCDALKMGAYVETAVAHAGVPKSVHYRWMKRAANEELRREKHSELLDKEAIEDDARARKIQQKLLDRRVIREREHLDACICEQVYVDYRDAIQKAMAVGEMGALGVVAKTAAGGAVVSRTVTMDAKGNPRTVEKLSRPEWTAAAWMLERRHPRKYGKLIRQEVTGQEGGPVAMTWADAMKEAFDPDSDPETDFDGA